MNIMHIKFCFNISQPCRDIETITTKRILIYLGITKNLIINQYSVHDGLMSLCKLTMR